MICYIPFLKAKRGELTAMSELTPKVKKAICPFFDFPRKTPGYDPAGYSANTLSIATSLKKHWGTDAEFYFDDLDVAQTLLVEGEHQYAYALKSLKELRVIPVVAVDRTTHNNAVAKLKRDGEITSDTVAFRAERGDFEDFDLVADQLDYDLVSVFKEFEAIDLILDCRLCTGANVTEIGQQIASFVQKFGAAYNKIRRVIVTGSSIPPAIKDVIAVNSAATMSRRELEIITEARDLSEYEVVVGDYATVSPFYSDAEFEPWLFPRVTAPRLIYTFNHSHYVARGVSLESGGHDQYIGLISELCKKDFFRPKYSAGEDYLNNKRKRIGNKATNGTVVKPSIVAHITYMVLGVKL